MDNVYVLFWFDVEDCTVTQSDDAAKRIAQILERCGVRGLFKVVGQKARMLEQRVRYDVIDELKRHDIGFHSNWHGRRPQIAEYLAALDWEEGVAEFERREGPGLEDVRRLFGVNPLTYGQPGSNWAPQPFPVLRRWDIPTYVSGYGYVGVDCQPFWYGGVLCTSHMYGQRFSGEPQRHLIGLNFELGKPGELEKHKQLFETSREQLAGTGGLACVMNHPCTLVLERWFSTEMKSRELTEAGFRHFETFVEWVVSCENVKPTSGHELTRLYADRARGRTFSRDELRQLAQALTEEINFQVIDDVSVSPAEAFGLLTRCLTQYLVHAELPAEVAHAPVYNPIQRPAHIEYGTVALPAFCAAVGVVNEFLAREGRVPDEVAVGPYTVEPADFLAAVARMLVRAFDGESLPEQIELGLAACAFERYVDEDAAKAGWRGAMMPSEFEALELLDLAKLGAWTLKPAILHA